MYKGSRFSIKNDDIIFSDIDFAATHYRHQNRLFLCDGDALILPQKRLVHILSEIKSKLPWVNRVGVYANTKSIRMKTVRQLQELKDLGLLIAYMGLESGDDITLQDINKGADAARMIEMGQKIRSAGMSLSITVLLGIAQRNRSQIHGRETGRVLTAIDPEYVGALSLMLTPGTPAHNAWKEGSWQQLTPQEMLEELKIILINTELSNGYFHANHASNYLPIKAKLPEDKQKTLSLIDQALNGEIGLKPEHMRGL